MSFDQNTFAERNDRLSTLFFQINFFRWDHFTRIAWIDSILCLCFPKMCNKWSNDFAVPIFTILSSSGHWTVKIYGSLRIKPSFQRIKFVFLCFYRYCRYLCKFIASRKSFMSSVNEFVQKAIFSQSVYNYPVNKNGLIYVESSRQNISRLVRINWAFHSTVLEPAKIKHQGKHEIR